MERQEAIEGLEGRAARGTADSSGPAFVEMAGTAINITNDFKANLAQLPEVANVESIELKFKDSGEVCGQFSEPWVEHNATRLPACSRAGAKTGGSAGAVQERGR